MDSAIPDKNWTCHVRILCHNNLMMEWDVKGTSRDSLVDKVSDSYEYQEFLAWERSIDPAMRQGILVDYLMSDV